MYLSHSKIKLRLYFKNHVMHSLIHKPYSQFLLKNIKNHSSEGRLDLSITLLKCSISSDESSLLTIIFNSFTMKRKSKHYQLAQTSKSKNSVLVRNDSEDSALPHVSSPF